jgi:hypothetical protein
MPLHRELFTDLPPAEKMRHDIAGNLAQKYNADGFYILAQLVAEKYGDQAYALAEEVFKEMGLQYDPQALRTPDLVRRIDYNFAGSNIYNLQVKPFTPEMAGEVVRLYNEQIRKVSYAALINQEDFLARIAGVGRLLVAWCEGGQPVGFIHCTPTSIDMLIYSHGRIYEPVRKALVAAAKEYFSGQTPGLLTGQIRYPFYTAVPENQLAALEKNLTHVAAGLKEFSPVA